jgi:hypothetical protein
MLHKEREREREREKGILDSKERKKKNGMFGR